MSRKKEPTIAEMLVGLKIAKVVGVSSSRKEKDYDVCYILFDDEHTLIEFSEQDYYTYHDCSTGARIVQLRDNFDFWKQIYNDEQNYPVANEKLLFSFMN